MQQDQPKDSQTESEQEKPSPREEELIKLGPPVTCVKGEHSFQVIGLEMGMRKAQCMRCPIGYYLGPNDDLEDGHIYINEKLVI
jgi:hypothetical protein